ncbi:sensor histidine kinase [Zavarzinia sp. CC-PAN008]|uniref:sensor histidine kinase n=1 Tax=Zavarzinia sp. CC-PAN008 TaxID=3243332 RepID=UPI003F743429
MATAFWHSLRLRLLLFAVAGTAVAITAATFALLALFDRYLEHRVGQELDSHIVQIAAQLRLDPQGRLVLAAEPGDPRFQRPLGGLYWQALDAADGTTLRSRSLWDGSLVAPDAALAAGEVRASRTTTPDGRPALQHDRTVILTRAGADHPVRVSVAIDRTALTELRGGFFRDLLPGLALLGLLILAGAWVQVRAGLAPLKAVGQGLARVRDGSTRRLEAAVPPEIEPLVAKLNDLLAAQDQAMQRARDRAVDLAHGLKTPLTALAGDVQRLRQAGQAALAAEIEAVGSQMQRTIDRELARARLRYRSGPADAPVKVVAVADAIVRTLRRTPRGEALDFVNEVPAGHGAAILAEDLADILGNLMENATRAARSTVRIGSSIAGGDLSIVVEDDGPGLAAEDLPRLAARGGRRDEGGGAGLGLAIVGDIVEAYGGALAFDRSALGGLRVRCDLPRRSPGAAPSLP